MTENKDKTSAKKTRAIERRGGRGVSAELLFNILLAACFLLFSFFYLWKNEFLFPRGYGFFADPHLQDRRVGNYKELDRVLKEKLRKVERDYNESFYRRMDYVDVYGRINQILGRTVLDDAAVERSVVRGSNGILYYMMQKRVDTDEFVAAFFRLHTFLEQDNIPFVYVQAPNKHMVHSSSFPAGVMDYCNSVSQGFISELGKKSILTLDLDEAFARHRKDEREMFYITDNHWNIHGAFFSYVSLIRYLETLEVGKKLVNTVETTDIRRYELSTWPAEYIGGIGKRVGLGFSDIRDDYEMLFPKYKNEFEFEKKGVRGNVVLSRRGNFREVFFFPDYLEDDDIYGEKYTVFMGAGTAEELIKNVGIKDGLKVLLIKDSFAMPIAGFLSQNCESLTLLDIRNFAKPRSIEDFVRDGDFDLVLFIASPIGMYYFPEMFAMPNH